MAKASLVGNDIDLGARILQHLDEHGFVVTALWILDPDSQEWRLVLASPIVDQAGPKQSYQALQHQLRMLDDRLLLSDVSLVGPGSPLVRALRGVIHTDAHATEPMRISKTIVDNALIDDAIVYRLS